MADEFFFPEKGTRRETPASGQTHDVLPSRIQALADFGIALLEALENHHAATEPTRDPRSDA